VLGSRYQKGYFETHALLNGLDPADPNIGLFPEPPSKQDFTVDFERVNLYAYDIWRIAPWLSITGGLTYDKLRYPQNYRSPPIDDDETSFTRTSPKSWLHPNSAPNARDPGRLHGSNQWRELR
jgi:hypothetical protein